MITTSSSAIRLSSFVSPPSTVSILLYQEMSMIKNRIQMSELITGTLSSVILYFPRASTFNPPKPPPG